VSGWCPLLLILCLVAVNIETNAMVEGGGQTTAAPEGKHASMLYAYFLNGFFGILNTSLVQMIILKWILRKLGGKMWTGCFWPRRGTSEGLL
jgi:hypothetical protein